MVCCCISYAAQPAQPQAQQQPNYDYNSPMPDFEGTAHNEPSPCCVLKEAIGH
jgi:hypothetical protein